jgi:hypothetical protein
VQHYYVSKLEQSNGNHEVHVPRCTYFPDPEERVYLGTFTRCDDAVEAAKKMFTNSGGCPCCCNSAESPG